MLLVFFARMVDDLLASVVASAAERGKAFIGQELEAPRARVELLPARPPANVHWVDGNWEWKGRHWAWQAGHWYETRASRLGQKHAELAHGVASSRRPNLMLMTASGIGR
jgi:hypothetical protein